MGHEHRGAGAALRDQRQGHPLLRAHRCPVAPTPVPSGYRVFGEEAVERLAFVRSAQALGLTLGEIQGIVAMRDRGETPCDHVLRLVRQHARDIDERIATLQRLRGELAILARRGERLDPRDCLPSCVCHIISAGDLGSASG